jgi:E3 ubiquitin-protein ligase UBR7
MCIFVFIEPTVTKISAEDDGLVLNVDGIGDQEVMKPENGDHQDNTLKEDAPQHGENTVKEIKAEQNNEPCTSSSSESDPQVINEVQATKEMKLVIL